MGAVWMALPPLCRGVVERDVQWDQGSFHGVRLSIFQLREQWHKLPVLPPAF